MPRHVILILCCLPALLVLTLILAPEGRLACAEPYLRETSPDSAWTLTICGRRRFFAMPGSSSDAPGWIVLRDREGAIRGVSGLSMLQAWGDAGGMGTEWRADKVVQPLALEMPLHPAPNAFRRWLDDRIWRLRALAGLTTQDSDFR